MPFPSHTPWLDHSNYVCISIYKINLNRQHYLYCHENDYPWWNEWTMAGGSTEVFKACLNVRGGISLWLYIENNKLWDWKKNVFTLHIPTWAPHTHDFVVLTSLTHPRKIIFGCEEKPETYQHPSLRAREDQENIPQGRQCPANWNGTAVAHVVNFVWYKLWDLRFLQWWL
jgi:hypothetical protein